MHAHSIAPHIYSVDHIVRTEVNIHPEVIDLTVTPDPSRIRIAFSCSVTVNYLEDMSAAIRTIVVRFLVLFRC